MLDPSQHSTIASSLRRLLATRYSDLFLVLAILLIPKIVLFAIADISTESSIQPRTIYALVEGAADYIVFPGCLLTILYINSSVLKAEIVGLRREAREATGKIVAFLVLGFIEYGLPLVAVNVVIRILVAADLLEKGNTLVYGLTSAIATICIRFIFLFSMPLLVEANIKSLKNVRQSLRLFGKYCGNLLPMLGFSVLIGATGLLRSFNLINSPLDLLLIGYVIELLMILYYAIALNYYLRYTAES